MSDRLLHSGVLSAPERVTLQEHVVAVYRSALKAWRRYHSRQRISELDAHTLKDIGVTYAQAEAEANKPFWRA